MAWYWFIATESKPQKRCMKPLSNKRSKKIIKQRYEINQKKISSRQQPTKKESYIYTINI